MTCPNCGYHLPQEPAADPCGASHPHPYASPNFGPRNGFEGVRIHCMLPRGHAGPHEMPIGGGYSTIISQDLIA